MQTLARKPIFAIAVLAVAAAFASLWLFASSDIVHGAKGGGKPAPVELLLIDKDTIDDRRKVRDLFFTEDSVLIMVAVHPFTSTC